MNALRYLIRIHTFGAGGFWSRENPKRVASNSELRRWMLNNSVHINGKPVKPDAWIDMDDLHSVVLFPKSAAHRITVL